MNWTLDLSVFNPWTWIISSFQWSLIFSSMSCSFLGMDPIHILLDLYLRFFWKIYATVNGNFLKIQIPVVHCWYIGKQPTCYVLTLYLWLAVFSLSPEVSVVVAAVLWIHCEFSPQSHVRIKTVFFLSFHMNTFHFILFFYSTY